MAIEWTDTPYGQMPQMSTGVVGGYASAPLDWGFLPQRAVQLGWDPQAAVDAGAGATDAAAAWLQSQGYTPKVGGEGSTYYNGVCDKSGNLIAKQGLDSAKTARGDLTGLLTTVGLPALGGAYLSGALGGPGAAAPGWTSGFDLPMGANSSTLTGLLGPQGLDAINGMSPAFTSGAAPAGITTAAIDATPVTMADMLATMPDAAALGGALPAATTVASWLKDAAPWLKTAAPFVGAAVGAYDAQHPQTAVKSQTIDPRLEPYVYGSGGVLDAASKLFAKQAQPSADQTAAMDMLRGILTDPQTLSGFKQMQQTGLGLMSPSANPAAGWQPLGLLGGMPDLTQYRQPQAQGLLGIGPILRRAITR